MDSHDRRPQRPPVPLTPVQLQARTLAGERREAIRLRTRRIRRSIAALAAALFSTAFLVIYVQLASGHDPALLANTKRAAASADEASSSATRADTGASGAESSSSASKEASSATAVTTSQS
jgi:hypothetical protein